MQARGRKDLESARVVPLQKCLSLSGSFQQPIPAARLSYRNRCYFWRSLSLKRNFLGILYCVFERIHGDLSLLLRPLWT